MGHSSDPDTPSPARRGFGKWFLTLFPLLRWHNRKRKQWQGDAVGDDRDEKDEGDHCNDGETNGDIPTSHLNNAWRGWIYAYT
jgi:hypothetical protein